MATKKTNQEILTAVANASEEEAQSLGITEEVRKVATLAADGSPSALSSIVVPGTTTYNAMLGVIVKIATTPLRWAKYTDVYAAHHRNFIQGKPERNFIDVAKKGTGNSAQLQTNTAGLSGTLTSVVTATTPDVYSVVSNELKSFEARIPISTADYKNAFSQEYGLSDFIGGLRMALENSILEQRNAAYDEYFESAAGNAAKAPVTTSTAAGMVQATYVDVVLPNVYAYLNTGSALPDNDDLLTFYAKIKSLYYALTGRPVSDYNGAGVKNNVVKDELVLYVHADLYAELTTRVDSFASNEQYLTEAGLKIVPMQAPWLGSDASTTSKTIAAIGSSNFIVDYPVNDYESTVQVDRGEIVTRYFDAYFSQAGFEPFVFINASSGNTGGGT